MKSGHKFLGSTIHIINDKFDSGDIVSQDYFELKSYNRLYNYCKVLSLSSDLLKDFILKKNRKIPTKILNTFK